jgi:hypothetical protein
MGREFAHIYRFKPASMDEFVLKPREFCGIEGLYQPVDLMPRPADTAIAGMVGQSNLRRPAPFNFKRGLAFADGAGERRNADTGTLGHRRRILRAARIGFHDQLIPRCTTGIAVFDAWHDHAGMAICMTRSRCRRNSCSIAGPIESFGPAANRRAKSPCGIPIREQPAEGCLAILSRNAAVQYEMHTKSFSCDNLTE